MGRIIQELEHALPGLSKAVFSQRIDKLSDEKVVVRPVSTKTGIAYQAESFRNNKAFHRNLTADTLLRYAEEELVSGDIAGTNYESIFDPFQTKVLPVGEGLFLVEVATWFDNETSYVSHFMKIAEML